ncbi:hypothetical protein [Cohnella sp.]|uniref:hypothetical protein n=1 Tax=Cohnella sp. TaxID=1883426 RepID=UPI00356228D7
MKRKGTTQLESRKFRQVWSFIAVRWTLLMLPFVVLGRWKKRVSRNSETEKRNTSWHLIYYRKEKSRR